MATPSPSDLRAQANELIQSDSPVQRAMAQRLFLQAAELEGCTVAPACNAHIDAYHAAQRAAESARVMASVPPRIRAALADIAAGRLMPSHLRRA